MIDTKALAEALIAAVEGDPSLLARLKKIVGDQTTSQLLTPDQFAKMVGVSGQMIRGCITEGLPVIHVGTKPRIDPAVAKEWLKVRGKRPAGKRADAPASPPKDRADVEARALAARAGLAWGARGAAS